MKRKPDHRYDETGKVFFGVLIYLFVFVYGMRDIYRRSTIETISYIICMGSVIIMVRRSRQSGVA